MHENVGGIDPHQDTFTVGIISPTGIELDHQTFANRTHGFLAAAELLGAHSVTTVGVEGSASWGLHVSIALSGLGFDCREVPAQRSAAQRRSRRLDKTDALDAISTARALAAEPTLGPVQAVEVFSALLAKIEAVLEHRRILVNIRTLTLQELGDQINKLPSEIRDQLTTTGKLESRLRRLEQLDPDTNVPTIAGQYRLNWIIEAIDTDRAARRKIRQLERDLDELLDQHGTSLREESGIGPIAAATLLVEIGDPHRFATESKFARWCGTGAVALSSGEGSGRPVRHRLDLRGNRRVNSILHIASITQKRENPQAAAYYERKTSEGKTNREARRSHKRHLANRIIRCMWKDENKRLGQAREDVA